MAMQDTPLFAVTALDGRYREKVQELSEYVSEAGLIRFRIRVEAAWLLHLADHGAFSGDLNLTPVVRQKLNELAQDPPLAALAVVKETEKTTNHDVKAVEYYLRQELKAVGATDSVLAFIHFACTSEDINNLSYGLMLEQVRQQSILPQWDAVLSDLRDKTLQYADTAMLSRTHGQTASPTTLGKELAVFGHRLARQRSQLAAIRLEGKMSGAVGNYNAHLSAYPEVDWMELGRSFIEDRLGLKWNPFTTQIENHDSMIEYVDAIRRFNVILIGFCRDMWGYISLGYFRQQIKANEVGSSTMPHKVNPIDFENGEGNLGIAIALAQHFGEKLPISRWQRDLSDSTVQRVLGTFLGHSVLAYKSILKGMSRVKADPLTMNRDLDQTWEVLAEPVQTVMRRYGVVDAYERLKAATRGHEVTKEMLDRVVDSCDELPDKEKRRIKNWTPHFYTGLAAELARRTSLWGT